MLSASEVAYQRALVAADGHIPFLATLRPVGLLGVSLHDLWHLSNAVANSSCTEPITIEDDAVVTSIVGSQNGLHVRNPYAKSLKAPPAYIAETAVALGSKKFGSGRKPLTSSSSSAAAYSGTGGSVQRTASGTAAYTQRSMNMYLAATNSAAIGNSSGSSSAMAATAAQQSARQMPTAAAATQDVYADIGSVYVGVQPTASAGNTAVGSKFTNHFNSAFTGKTTATATDIDLDDDVDYTVVEAVSAKDWRTKAESATRQPSELTRSLSEQLVAASKARFDAQPQQQQQQQGSASIDSVISLSSDCSNGDHATETVAAAVRANNSEVCIIDDDDADVSSDVSADVCSDVDDCVTGLRSLQLVSAEQSSTADSTSTTTASPVAAAAAVANNTLLNAVNNTTAKLQEADVAGFSDSDNDSSAASAVVNSAAAASTSTKRQCSECAATYTVVSASSVCRCSLTAEDVTAYNALLKAAQAAEAICAVLACDDDSCDTAAATSAASMNEEQLTALQQALCAYMDCVSIWDGDSVLHDKIAALGRELGFNDCY
jgi:hypothetical protein